MLRKFIFSKKGTWISNSIIMGVIFGGVLGAVAGFLYFTAIPGIGYNLQDSPVYVIVRGIVPGILIGAGISSLIGLYITRSKAPKNYSKLQLREEQLDISKRRVQTGEVTVHKEVLKEEKNIVVPVTREELVIEKKVLDKEASNKINEHTETIRIPISEERIEISKHPAALEDVAIYKRQMQGTEHVEELLKKEKLHMKTTGDPEIVNKEP